MIMESWFDPAKRQSRSMIWAVAAVGAVLFAGTYGGVLTAQFGIVDDHEIMSYLTGGDFGFDRIWSTAIDGTEVGRPFDTNRYRPSYHILRLFETWLWGDWAMPWYAVRLLIFAYFLYESVLLTGRLLGPGYGALFFLMNLASRVYVDIFARIGPGESYAALGCALCLTAARHIDRNEGVRPVAVIVLCVGTLVATGAKENMAFLLLPLALVLVRQKGSLLAPTRLLLAATLAAGLVIWAAVLPGTFGRGVNVYQDPVPKIEFLAAYPVAGSLAVACLIGLGLLVAGWAVARGPLSGVLEGRQREILLWCGLFVIATAFQLAAYGEISLKRRYGFPALPMLLFMGLAAVRLVHTRLGASARPASLATAVPVVAGMLALLLTGLWTPKTLAKLNESVEDTRIFQERYATLAAAIREKPGAGVVLIAHSYSDYEPVMSVRSYLLNEFGSLPIALSVEDPEAYSGQRLSLITVLRDIQESGGFGFVALSQLDLSNCVGVGYHGVETALPCPVVTQMWPLR